MQYKIVELCPRGRFTRRVDIFLLKPHRTNLNLPYRLSCTVLLPGFGGLILYPHQHGSRHPQCPVPENLENEHDLTWKSITIAPTPFEQIYPLLSPNPNPMARTISLCPWQNIRKRAPIPLQSAVILFCLSSSAHDITRQMLSCAWCMALPLIIFCEDWTTTWRWD